jgi:hypothetical protein
MGGVRPHVDSTFQEMPDPVMGPINTLGTGPILALHAALQVRFWCVEQQMMVSAHQIIWIAPLCAAGEFRDRSILGNAAGPVSW